jgi:hypothetical protein
MWYRFLLASMAVLGLLLLFVSQFRLTDALGRREDEAAHHLDDRRNGQ